MKKILFVATLSIHFQYFYLPYFKFLKDNGWEVSSVCLDPVEMPCCDKNYGICIERLPYNAKNILAYKQLKEIINSNKFDVIHCNTPMGGVLARLAAKKARKHGTKVIYTAHGFHFYKGAPRSGWLLYYPIELLLSRVTDCLITINDEDYCFAKKRLKAAEVVYVHGVGYDNEKFMKPSQEKKHELRRKNGYSDSDILLVYVAELNENKNQKVLIKAFERITEKNKKARLLLIGPDRLSGENQQLARDLGIDDKVDFWGVRTDVHELIPMCDIAVASSIREGLPVNIMESLTCGVPVVAADNRGHRALIKNGENGYLTKLSSAEELAEKVLEVIEDDEGYRRLSENASNGIVIFDKDHVLEEMKAIYGRM
ncbi:MAG: glycosyltransferase family 4 protein [Clostridiales bacterium]|nr:glycosyltransferase family 4 protein [Clostridiales bacterium]